MSVRSLNHVAVTVAELDRSLAFYEKLLGLRLRGRGEVAYEHLDRIIGLGPTRLRWAELDIGDGGMLELFEYVEPAGRPLMQRTCDPGNVHLAFEVADIEAVYRRLRDADITVRSEPVRIPFGDWEGVREVYAVDPDGVTVELLQLP